MSILNFQMSFETLWKEFEGACEAHKSAHIEERKRAEAWLMQLRGSDSFDFCLQVLLFPQATEYAKFQSTSALKSIFLNKWDDSHLSHFIEVQKTLFQHAVNPQTSFVICKQSLHLCALICKRNWFAIPESAHLTIKMIEQHISANQVSKTMLFCSALIDEFSSTKGSALGMSLQFHFECHKVFEQNLLQRIFIAVVHLLDNQQKEVQKSCISVLSQCLNWKFEEFIHKRKLSFLVSSLDTSFDDTLISSCWIQPGSSWRSLLLSHQFLHLLLSLYPKLRTDSAGRLFRSVILQLCSLRGTIFASESDRIEHCSIMMQIAMQLSTIANNPLENVFLGGEEILDLAQVYQRIVNNFQLQIIFKTTNGFHFLNSLSALSIFLLTSSSSEYDTDTWTSEAFDLTVDTLVSLVSHYDLNHGKVSASSLNALKQACSQVFPAFVERRLRMAEYLSVNEDIQEQFHDESYISERLSAVGYIGRIVSQTVLKHLSTCIEERILVLKEMIDKHVMDTVKIAKIQEDLFWVLHLVTFVLCDPSEGESPIVPSLIRLDEEEEDISLNVWVQSSNAVLHYLEYENNCIASENIPSVFSSPLVGELCIRFLQRWVPAYLMPQESLYDRISPMLWRIYGEGSEMSKQILRFVIKKVSINLFMWSHEWDLCLQTCNLVKNLVGQRKLRQEIMQLDQWAELVQLCTNPSAPIWSINLPGNVIVLLFQSITSACEENGQRREELWVQISQSVSNKFFSLLQSNDFQSVHKSVEFITELSTALDMLRGVCGSSVVSNDTNVSFAFLQTVAQPLLQLVQLYGDRKDILVSILGIFCDFTERNIIIISAHECKLLFEMSILLIREYGKVSHNRLLKLMGSNAENEDDLDDLEIMLRLLDHIYSKDAIDFGPDEVDFSADATIMGLSLVLSFVTEHILEYPDISKLLFQIVQDVISTHPDKLFSVLDEEARHRIITVIEFAIQSLDTQIVRSSLSALRQLILFEGSTASPVFMNKLPHFLEVLFKRLVEDHLTEPVLDGCSDCLLAMMLRYPNLLHNAKSFFMQKAHPHTMQSVSDAFGILNPHSLLREGEDPNGRKNRTQFRSLVGSFVERIRGVMHQK